MPTPLSPPEYPDCPEAPLRSFGLSFAEEIACSIGRAVYREDLERPHEAGVRLAASLTMLEALRPADHLQCMIAAQSVAFHAATMDCLARAMDINTPPELALKFQLNAERMRRGFSGAMHDVFKLQGRPLTGAPRAPRAKPPPPADPPPEPPPALPVLYQDELPSDDVADPADAMTAPPEPEAWPEDPDEAQSENEWPEDPDETQPEELTADIKTRIDGSPGSLADYMPTPWEPFVPKEALINIALATRPKEYYQVNAPKDAPPAEPAAPMPEPPQGARGPLDIQEDFLRGDAVARYASSRIDPYAPPPAFEEDDAIIELELLSTGGDPETEAHRAAMIAAHPEGKPISIIRLGPRAPARIPDMVPDGDEPPDTS
jgi:hypothetical protein